MHSVLFVCQANMIRSPIAEQLLKARVSAAGEAWRVESAGTWAPEGQRVTSRAAQVLEENHLSAAGHSSRQVSRELVEQFCLILTMEQGQKEALRIEFPDLSGRIFTLSEMAGLSHNIQDPIGGSLEDFRAAFRELEHLIKRGFARIERMSSDQP